MKRIITIAAATLFAASAANAAKNEYVATTVQGAVVGFSIENARRIEATPEGFLKLTYENGTELNGYLRNDQDALFTKIKNDNPHFLKHGTKVLYVSAKAYQTVCQGTNTVFGWPALGAEAVNDNCAMYNDYRQKFTN